MHGHDVVRDRPERSINFIGTVIFRREVDSQVNSVNIAKPRWRFLNSCVVFLVISILAVSWCCDGYAADSGKTEVLDDLFARLKVATDPKMATSIESAIWITWLESRIQKIDEHMAAGEWARKQRRLDDSLEHYNAAIEIDSEFAEAYHRRATVRHWQQDDDGALSDAERTLELESRHFGAMVLKGVILEARNQENAALDLFEQALALNPHIGPVREHADELAKKLGRGGE